MGGGAAAGPRGRGRGGPPFPRSVGGAPGLRRRHHQIHGPRGPPPATGGGARGGALPLAKGRRTRRAHPHSAPESGAEKLPPPPRRRLPPSRFPPRLTHGGGEPALGAPAAAPARPAETQAGGRRGRNEPGAVADRAPTHSLAGPPRGRIAFKTSPSPPPRPGRGRARGGAGAAVMCPRSRSAPTFFLRSPNSVPSPTQPQLSPPLSQLFLGPILSPTPPSGSWTRGLAPVFQRTLFLLG